MTPTETTPKAGDALTRVLERAEALAEDLRLTQVTRHKKENPGALAVGIMPIYAPRPLLEAMNVLPVGVFGGGDAIDIIRGDSYFQSYICHIPRSTLELGLNGALDPLDGMIFPSTCDVIRNLGGMWQLLFPQKYMSYLDLPQDFAPERGGIFYKQILGHIAKDLEKRGARPLTDKALWTAIENENERCAALRDLDNFRREKPWLVRASEAYLLTRAGNVITAREHTALLREFLALAQTRVARAYDNVRVIVSGAFCEQPPLGLIRTLEQAGCDLVEDDFQLGMKMIDGPIPTKASDLGKEVTGPLSADDPMDALVLAFLLRGLPTATRYIGKNEKGRALVDRVKANKADGVVFAAPSFCDPALLDQPMLEKALDDAKIPHTAFKYSENSAQFQTIREQAGAFSDSVKLWGDAA
jgi:benzoyl-CoA reductase subunit C